MLEKILIRDHRCFHDFIYSTCVSQARA